MLTEAGRVWDVVYLHVQDHALGVEFAGIFTPEKIGDRFECFPVVNNCSHCKMMDFRLFGNDPITFPRSMGSRSYFFNSFLHNNDI